MSGPARQPLMAGNWKMHLNHLEAIAHVQKLAFSLTDKDFEAVEVAVLPPFTDLRSVQTLVDGDKYLIHYGAQDVSPHEAGAYTGDVSAAMLAKLGCTYVVVGHSERRQYHGEDDALVGAKAKAAFGHGIVPIVCVGEPLDVREQGEHVAHTLRQVDGALDGIPAEAARQVVIAYEPVWAIGTGKVCAAEDAQEVCRAIRSRLAELYSGDVAAAVRVLYGGSDQALADGVRIQYGGSVKSGNVAAIMAHPDVDGALVGGASLDAEEFVKICRYRDQAVS
jgi:triosephosphate isomerase